MTGIGLYRAGQWCARALPARTAYWLADRLADWHHACSRRDRRIVRDNLRAVLGKDPRRLRAATREVFRQFARYLVDFLRIRRVDRAFVERHVEVEGLEHVRNALADGRGAIALTAHLGHWELAGMVTQALGYPVSAVALSHQDAAVNALFVRQRTTQGLEVIPMGQATRRCLGSLREGRVLALLGDRDFSHHAAINTLMFGRPTWIPRGPAVLSIKTRRPVVPGFLVRLEDDRFRLTFEPPIVPPAAGDGEDAVEELTRRYVAVMERAIRAYPSQWFLFQPFWHRAHDPVGHRRGPLKWCVLIPARNESAAIGGVVAALTGQGAEVLVVDDGSTDQTAQAARAAGARVLSRTSRHGKGAALRDGFAWAMSREYDAVVTVDADGQHAPEDVRRLVDAAASGEAGLIIGNRMRQPKRMPWLRRSTNGFMSAVLSVMAGQHVPDTQCGLRLIRTALLRDCRLQSDHFEIESELVLEAARLGSRIASIPIRSIYQFERSQINPLSDTYRFVRFLWHRAVRR